MSENQELKPKLVKMIRREIFEYPEDQDRDLRLKIIDRISKGRGRIIRSGFMTDYPHEKSNGKMQIVAEFEDTPSPALRQIKVDWEREWVDAGMPDNVYQRDLPSVAFAWGDEENECFVVDDCTDEQANQICKGIEAISFPAYPTLRQIKSVDELVEEKYYWVLHESFGYYPSCFDGHSDCPVKVFIEEGAVIYGPIPTPEELLSSSPIEVT